MKKKIVVKKKRAAHRAATPKKVDLPKELQHPFPEDQEQRSRLDALVEDVKEAFTRNQFAIPGDIDLQVRGMVTLQPHHSPLPETQLGPGVTP